LLAHRDMQEHNSGAQAPDRRLVVLRDDLMWEGEEAPMEFRLTYEGLLLASNVGQRNNRTARKVYKHEVRRQFHGQLKRLFEINPFLSTGAPSGRRLGGYAETDFPKYERDDVAVKHKLYGFTFLPLVTADLKLSCWLDILYLRRQPRGNLWQHGDIDNRLKTLFDCLQIPDANQGYELLSQQPDELPYFHCLVENDNLISKISVETDFLLQDLATPPDDNDARLIITVRLRPHEVTLENIFFGG
jgi:hypothetical protein